MMSNAVAAQHPAILEKLFLLLGRLNYAFTNTESLLIHMISGLANMDKEAASIIFLTLNTTRARVILVERLAKRNSVEQELRDEILHITRTMVDALKVKNKYNHCIYSFDNEEGQTSAMLMKIFDKKGEIKYGKLDPIDEAEIDHIRSVITTVEQLNRRIWKFLFDNKFPV